MTTYYAYLQGGEADLQKHALTVERPPDTLFIAHMAPVKIIDQVPDQTLPVKKLKYKAVGGWGYNVTYAYDSEITEIITK